MLDKGKIKFSDDVSFLDMEHVDDITWAVQWMNRLEQYYLRPAHLLNRQRLGFAATNLICAAIEAVGTIKYAGQASGSRFKKTSQRTLNINEDTSIFLYQHYRCGLTHNGRTNQSRGYRRPNELSVIDYDSPFVIEEKHLPNQAKVFVLNPDHLLYEFSGNFRRIFEFDDSELGRLIKEEFSEDLQIAIHAEPALKRAQ